MTIASGIRTGHRRRRRGRPGTAGRIRCAGCRIAPRGDSPAIVPFSPTKCGLSKTYNANIRHCSATAALLGERKYGAESNIVKSGIDPHAAEDLWVFGYGSLMWRPGFDCLERVPARLMGLHRALCVYSFVHRGTPERPGLVLGLDRGGMCRGIAFRVAARAREKTLAYLRGREQVTSVYLETFRRVELEEEARRQVQAVCFITDRSHVQYAGRLSLSECVHHVRQGHGTSGPNRDYVLETVNALEALGYRETDLHRIAEALRSELGVVKHRPAGVKRKSRS